MENLDRGLFILKCICIRRLKRTNAFGVRKSYENSVEMVYCLIRKIVTLGCITNQIKIDVVPANASSGPGQYVRPITTLAVQKTANLLLTPKLASMIWETNVRENLHVTESMHSPARFRHHNLTALFAVNKELAGTDIVILSVRT